MLIKIEKSIINGEVVNAVNAREIHDRLNVKTKYADWINRTINKYGFIDGDDFISYQGKSTGGRPAYETIVTLDVAKELCMVEPNDEGRKMRKYFIQVEKQNKQDHPQHSIPQTYAEALMVAAQQAYQIEEQQKQLELQAPKVNFANMVSESAGTLDVKTFCKVLFDKEGVNIGEKRLFAWFRNHGYLMTNGSDRNKPYQRFMEQGLFKLREGAFTNQSTGDKVPYTKTVITGKGQIYFAEKLKQYFEKRAEA